MKTLTYRNLGASDRPEDKHWLEKAFEKKGFQPVWNDIRIADDDFTTEVDVEEDGPSQMLSPWAIGTREQVLDLVLDMYGKKVGDRFTSRDHDKVYDAVRKMEDAEHDALVPGFEIEDSFEKKVESIKGLAAFGAKYNYAIFRFNNRYKLDVPEVAEHLRKLADEAVAEGATLEVKSIRLSDNKGDYSSGPRIYCINL